VLPVATLMMLLLQGLPLLCCAVMLLVEALDVHGWAKLTRYSMSVRT